LSEENGQVYMCNIYFSNSVFYWMCYTTSLYMLTVLQRIVIVMPK